MDQPVINQKLESLRRCVVRLETRCPDAVETLAADLDAQDIVSLNLTRAIQLCVDIASHWLAGQPEQGMPQTMGQAFTMLTQAGAIDPELADHLRKAVGFRNRVVHNYEEVNWTIVFHLCKERIPDFREFAAAFAGKLLCCRRRSRRPAWVTYKRNCAARKCALKTDLIMFETQQSLVGAQLCCAKGASIVLRPAQPGTYVPRAVPDNARSAALWA